MSIPPPFVRIPEIWRRVLANEEVARAAGFASDDEANRASGWEIPLLWRRDRSLMSLEEAARLARAERRDLG